MIEIKNSFAKHLLFWSWVLPLAAGLALPLLLSPDHFTIKLAEVEMIASGGADLASINEDTNRQFHELFMETGIQPMISKFFNEGVSKHIFPNGVSHSVQIQSDYNKGLWRLIYRALWRLNAFAHVAFAYLLALFIPACLDAAMVRARKAHNFELHNPVFFWGAGHSVVLMAGLVLFLPFLPVTLSLPMLLLCLAAACASAWVAISNFQTGT